MSRGVRKIKLCTVTRVKTECETKMIKRYNGSVA